MNTDKLKTIVIGGSGYVAGECLRLLGQHPIFHSPSVVSESRPHSAVVEAFPHLRAQVRTQRFASLEDATRLVRESPTLILAAAPHGVSAGLIDTLLTQAAHAGMSPAVVDLSADYRLRDATLYEQIYGQAHGAPARLNQFVCALPEHLPKTPTALVSHPGCFATAMLLSIWPLLRQGISASEFYCTGITGSTGSGRQPTEGTHHPLRHSDVYSYKALAHRHSPEVMHLLALSTGITPRIHFVPHSGPFARGIHMTVQARLHEPLTHAALLAVFNAAYAEQPCVAVLPHAPRLKDVVGTNYAHLGVHTDGHSVAITTVIDNLIKGAAGGGIQWANRLFGLAPDLGLTSPALGYT
jgi:N-acetyl-gamma-glutamyl-phosphate reductase common form